jgi:hypothetical protein
MRGKGERDENEEEEHNVISPDFGPNIKLPIHHLSAKYLQWPPIHGVFGIHRFIRMIGCLYCCLVALYWQNVWPGKYLANTVPKRRRSSAYLRNIDEQIFCPKSGELTWIQTWRLLMIGSTEFRANAP